MKLSFHLTSRSNCAAGTPAAREALPEIQVDIPRPRPFRQCLRQQLRKLRSVRATKKPCVDSRLCGTTAASVQAPRALAPAHGPVKRVRTKRGANQELTPILPSVTSSHCGQPGVHAPQLRAHGNSEQVDDPTVGAIRLLDGSSSGARLRRAGADLGGCGGRRDGMCGREDPGGSPCRARAALDRPPGSPTISRACRSVATTRLG